MLSYAMSYPNAEIHFHASDMQLICYSHASYLSESKLRSRVGVISYLGPQMYGPILCTSIIFDNAAVESEYGAAFENAREAIYIRQTLEALGYKQLSTPIVTNKYFVKNITN
jgi:hypothetical protein